MPGLSVCVFCSSSEAVGDAERAVAADLGRRIAARGWRLVYGGGNIGLMGEVARAVLGASGTVLGVIPHRLATEVIALEDVTSLVLVDTMRERKAIMDAESHGFVVLPGGIGTLEELVEIVTLKQLGYHDRPVVLLDPDAYWAPLLQQLDLMVARGLAGAGLLDMFDSVSTVSEALDLVAMQLHRTGDAGPEEELETVESPPGAG